MTTEKKISEVSSFIPKLIGFSSIILLLGGFSAWAFFAEIDGAVVAPGRIVVDRNGHAVQHLVGGVVDEILVSDGDAVEAEALLVRLDPTSTLSELAIVEGQLYELMARRGRLEAERDSSLEITFDPILLQAGDENQSVQDLMDGQIRLFNARVDSLEKSMNQLNSQRQQLDIQIGGFDAQMVASERQLALVLEETQTQEYLMEKGLADNARLLNLRREDARLAGLRGELTAGRAQAMQQISEVSIQELRLHTQRREEAITILRDLHFNELEMIERRQLLMIELQRMNVKAPVAGVIHDVKLLGTRSVVRSAETLMFIIANDRPLVVEAEIDPVDVDKVYSNQRVILRFATFDMRSTPDLFGYVTLISPDALVNQQTGRSFYRAEVELPKSELAKLSTDQTLLPGMPVDLFMRTGEYTPIAYIMSPLTQFFQRAMRDS